MSPVQIFRLRVSSGEGKDTWLWMLGVTKGGLPLQKIDWGVVLPYRSQYEFRPRFIDNKSSAFLFLYRRVAETVQRILSEMGIETEVVPETQPDTPLDE